MDKLRRMAEIQHHAHTTISHRMFNIDRRLKEIEQDLQAITSAVIDLHRVEAEIENFIKESAAKVSRRN